MVGLICFFMVSIFLLLSWPSSGLSVMPIPNVCSRLRARGRCGPKPGYGRKPWCRRRPRCRRCSRRGCGCGRWCWCRSLHFKRPDVDPAVDDAIKPGAALVVERRRSEVRVACIDGRTAGQQRVREGWSTVVLQSTKHRIGIDLIAQASQIAAAVITAQVVTERANRAELIVNIFAQSSSVENRVADRQRRAAPGEVVTLTPVADAAAVAGRVAAHCAVGDRQRRGAAA